MARTYTFPYRPISSSKFLRPFIPLTLRNKEKTIKTLALVDSGADFCMFDEELAELLEIDLAQLEKIELSGVAGAAKGRVAYIEIGVEGNFFACPVVFSAAFTPDDFGGLAGQLGFFDNFIVTFNRSDKSVSLK